MIPPSYYCSKCRIKNILLVLELGLLQSGWTYSVNDVIVGPPILYMCFSFYSLLAWVQKTMLVCRELPVDA